MKRDQILDTAKQTICHDRNDQYGEPEDNFRRIAEFWTAYLGPELPRSLTAADVANMMILFKVARNASGSMKDDNWIDLCGYAACGGEVSAKERQVIVTWYDPAEKLPPDDEYVVIIVSGRRNDNQFYEHAIGIGAYYSGKGWLIDGVDEEESSRLTVEAWCDLDAIVRSGVKTETVEFCPRYGVENTYPNSTGLD